MKRQVSPGVRYIGREGPSETHAMRRLREVRERLEAIPPRRGALVGTVFGLLLGLVCFVVVPGWPSLIVAAAICAAVLLAGATSRLVFSAPTIAIDATEPYAVVGPATDLPNELIPMIGLPRGTFWMGSTPEERQRLFPNEHALGFLGFESPRHQVAVSAFAIATTTVAREHWNTLGLAAPKEWQPDESPQLPANYVDLYDAVHFCNALSARAGLTPAYEGEGKDWRWNREADGYRLPTEAEWEYACRAGTETAWFCGDVDDELSEFAVFSGGRSSPETVASRKPNPWGLFDMAGNVLERCWDGLRTYDGSAVQVRNPVGPMEFARAMRGGAYWCESVHLSSASRYSDSPLSQRADAGFRVVRTPRRPHD